MLKNLFLFRFFDFLFLHRFYASEEGHDTIQLIEIDTFENRFQEHVVNEQR